ncbi:unnamed protein product [Cunninghamella blakesleeana]
MYDSDLKYISISYRWGEVPEQLVKTPDYTAHVTSFFLNHLVWLCLFIKNEPDLKDIPYIWIDAISVDQQNHNKKKETILKMNQIYEKASYILAVPDLHRGYLWNNTANYEMINLIKKYRDIIHHDIYNNTYSSTIIDSPIDDSIQHMNNDAHNYYSSSYYYSTTPYLIHPKEMNGNNELRKERKEMKLKKESKEELKKAYQFLAYLLHDWSNRAWVISEYQIAKLKYRQHGTPLKYIFLSLLSTDELFSNMPFFTYTFTDQLDRRSTRNGGQYLSYYTVDNSVKMIRFLELTFTERPHLDMLLRSKASRNEDRFYAILPSWNKYNHFIENKSTISNWVITDMLSVKLKLYEMMEKNDLWNKARLLLYGSIHIGKPILPSFATYHNSDLIFSEIDYTDLAYHDLIEYLSEFKKDAKQYIDDYNIKHGTIFKQNLIDIQYHQQMCFLSVKTNSYFLFNTLSLSSIGFSKEDLLNYSLQENGNLRLIYIPYFTYAIPEFMDLFPVYKNKAPLLAGTLLLETLNKVYLLYFICRSNKRHIFNGKKSKIHRLVCVGG